MLPNSTERAVTVSGGSEAITQCIYNICNIMAEVTITVRTTNPSKVSRCKGRESIVASLVSPQSVLSILVATERRLGDGPFPAAQIRVWSGAHRPCPPHTLIHHSGQSSVSVTSERANNPLQGNSVLGAPSQPHLTHPVRFALRVSAPGAPAPVRPPNAD